ncbi:MAG TPA: L,D-transpeptidase [Thermoanaerobaculia bacterium]|nr:L,D-transpeptidase [Thermoanaerobaculia bacterium]
MKTTTRLAGATLLMLALACSRDQAHQAKEKAQGAAQNVATKVRDTANEVNAPFGGPKDDPKAREQQRFDEQWRQLQSFREQQAAQAAAQQAAAQQQAAADQAQAAKLVFTARTKKTKESFKGLDLGQLDAAPILVPIRGDVSGPSVLKAQVYLDRADFSVGALDGRWGRNSAISTWWYQRAHGLESTGEMDEPTFRSLASTVGYAPALTRHTLTADDLKGPFVSIPEDVYDKEKLDCLCYESVREKLAEKFHTTEDFLDMLNPDVKFSELETGATLVVPNVREPMTADRPDIAKVVVSLNGNTLNGFDASGRLIFHAPTTVGSKYDPSPNETVKVAKIVQDPHFHYQPTLFHEVPDSDPEAHLQPGPNSPVGVVWIALSKPHFGIHGTSDPDSIGYASSHGCVRLTNWDAEEASHRLAPNVEVEFKDTRKGSGAEAAR